MALKAKHLEKEGVTIIRLKGHLDSLTVDDLNYEFSQVMRAHKKKILLVMKNVNYVSSAIVRVFLSFNHWSSQMGGELKVSSLRPNVIELFRMMGLNNVLSIYDSEKDALASFGE
jgi:anti-sigma B factor antagonist